MSLWMSKKVLRSLQERLAQGPKGPVAAPNLPRLCKALVAANVPIVELSETRELAAIVIEGTAKRSEEELASYGERLVPGGRLLCIDRGAPAQVTRLLLCSGLSDIEQEPLGRRMLTSARMPI